MTDPGAGHRVERFCKTTRWFHWTFALSFLVLAASGGALWARESLGLGPETVDALLEVHEIVAVVFLTAPWLIALSGDTRRWLADLTEVTRFGRHDLEWLVRQPLAMLGRAELPAQDKLNAGQKLNALTVAVVSGVMSVSGLQLWLERGAFVPLMVHLVGFAVWIPSFAVHFYMAVLNSETRPALRGMLLGSVSRAWAKEHHGRWIASLEAEDLER